MRPPSPRLPLFLQVGLGRKATLLLVIQTAIRLTRDRGVHWHASHPSKQIGSNLGYRR